MHNRTDLALERAAGFPEVSFLLSEGFSPAQIMDLFMGDPEMKYLDAAPVSFECTCSRERMSAGLAALSKADLEDLIKDGKPVETCCRFCNRKYEFGTAEISDFLKNR